MDNEKRKEKHKRQINASGIKSQSSSVDIKCTNCNKIDLITTTKPEIYTEEVRKSYLCWKCKPPKSKVVLKETV